MTGEPSLPHELQVGRFLEAREAEIKALEGELVRTGKGKLASQQVTPHIHLGFAKLANNDVDTHATISGSQTHEETCSESQPQEASKKVISRTHSQSE